MDIGPTLKEQQLAWAVAWQDHGDRAALAKLCASVDGFVIQQAVKRARDDELREELLAEYRLAVVEAAGQFDRNRPEGFVRLCGYVMLDRTQRVFNQRVSPASLPPKVWHPARRVAISDDTEDEPTVSLAAPEEYSEDVPGAGVLHQAIDQAKLTAKEWRTIHRFLRGETQEDLGEIWGCAPQGVAYYEKTALEKIRRVLKAKGLVLEDLL